MGEWLSEDRENLRQIKAMLAQILKIKLERQVESLEQNMPAVSQVVQEIKLNLPSMKKKGGRPKGSKNKRKRKTNKE